MKIEQKIKFAFGLAVSLAAMGCAAPRHDSVMPAVPKLDNVPPETPIVERTETPPPTYEQAYTPLPFYAPTIATAEPRHTPKPTVLERYYPAGMELVFSQEYYKQVAIDARNPNMSIGTEDGAVTLQYPYTLRWGSEWKELEELFFKQYEYAVPSDETFLLERDVRMAFIQPIFNDFVNNPTANFVVLSEDQKSLLLAGHSGRNWNLSPLMMEPLRRGYTFYGDGHGVIGKTVSLDQELNGKKVTVVLEIDAITSMTKDAFNAIFIDPFLTEDTTPVTNPQIFFREEGIPIEEEKDPDARYGYVAGCLSDFGRSDSRIVARGKVIDVVVEVPDFAETP